MAKYTPRIDHSKKDYEMSHEDIAEDKKLIKKAIRMHDEQEHDGDKTDLSKLKKGGRAKKKVGTVRQYKSGGLCATEEIKKKPDAGSPKKTVEKYKRGGKC